MRVIVIVVIFAAIAINGFAAQTPLTVAQIAEAREALRRTTSLQFYQSLLKSPISAWVVVHGDIAGDRLLGARIVRSNAAAEFNDLALELAHNLQILRGNISRQHANRAVLLHVLVYDIADGKLAVS